MDARKQFKELLYQTVLNTNVMKEDAIKENLKLRNWVLDHLPPKLFDLDLVVKIILKIWKMMKYGEVTYENSMSPMNAPLVML